MSGMVSGIYRSRSRSPMYRNHSPGKKLPPPAQLEGERKYTGRYRELPPYDAKAYYGRNVDQSDPYERERYREWEREYREWYDKYFKNYNNPPSGQMRSRVPGSRDAYSPERFAPPRPRENSPYNRGRREDYPPPPQSHSAQSRGRVAMTYQEKCAEKFGHLHANTTGTGRSLNKEPLKPIKDREQSGNSATDSKSLKHKKHRKKKREDGDLFSHSDSMDESRKDDRKMDSMLINSSRDDATPVRDEPMDGAAVPYKRTPEKEKKEKTKSKSDKVKRKSESSGQKKEASGKTSKSAREKESDAPREKVASTGPAIKRVKEEPPHKSEPSKTQSSDPKLMLPRKLMQSRPLKHHQELKAIKDEIKSKKDLVKDPAKQDKASGKDGKASKKDPEKPFKMEEKIPAKVVDAKQDKKKRRDDKSSVKDPDGPPVKVAKMETDVVKTSPKPKPKLESERPVEKDKPAIPSLLDIKPEPVRKIKINREIGKRISSTDRPVLAEDSAHGPGKGRLDKSRGKLRRKVHAPDGSGSLLVDYTSTSSTGGSPIRKHEEKIDLKKTVVKTLEEYTNDSSTPAEDEIVMIQVPRSKWEKEDYESEDDDSKVLNRTSSADTSVAAPSVENSAVKLSDKESPHSDKAQSTLKEADVKPAKDSTSGDKEKDTDKDRERERTKEKDRSSTILSLIHI